jgi:AcrR family transcriptional regulator
MAQFQRARTDQQRAERRAAILQAGRDLLRARNLDAVTLADLARGAGIAPSAVLRYFDSREAVLLELVLIETAEWLDDLLTRPMTGPGQPFERVATAMAHSLASHPQFCELISAQAVVLERHVSAKTALRFKSASSAELRRFSTWLRTALPKVGPPAASERLAAYTTLLAGALWAQSRSSEQLRVQLPPEVRATMPISPFREQAEEALRLFLRGAMSSQS